MALPQRHRLRSPRTFSQVYKKGRRSGATALTVRALQPTPPGQTRRVPSRDACVSLGTRFGVSISRKVSKKAVVRNRIKRQIHAALTTLMPGIRPGWWVVISVRSAAVTCEYDDFLRELTQLLTALEVFDGS